METTTKREWKVDDARGGGWAVSLHTEQNYTEFIVYTRHEADALTEHLNALEVCAALLYDHDWHVSEYNEPCEEVAEALARLRELRG